MTYIKSRIVVIPKQELKCLILTGACSTYGEVCIEPGIFSCDQSSHSSSCSTYDQNKCDPMSAPNAGHGNYPNGKKPVVSL